MKARKLSPRLTLPVALLLAGSTLGGCVTTGSQEINNTTVACGAFNPITWSHKDTKITVRQIVGHNASGKALCGWTPPVYHK